MKRTTEIGMTGLCVASIAFGTSALGHMPETYGYGVEEERAPATVTAILARPNGFLDTSRNYG
ncbi:MAG: aldo/keto reductase, partial [Rhodobacteraceae bacterium]|nr:aldo/keto reductase [Paracoccaceae bacterium]